MNDLEREKESPNTSSKIGSRLEKTTPTILIVDDEPLALNRAKAVFSSSDYRILTCNNAIEAMALLENETIDCIVTDIIMPVIDGYEMIRNIRKTNQEVPVLVLSRKRLREDVTAALQAGADDYALKPIDDQVFLDKIEANIRKGEAKRHVFEYVLHGGNLPAEIRVEACVLAISEADITLGLSSPINPQTRIDLTSKIFDEIGIVPPILRLTHCRKVPPGGAVSAQTQYEARYAFMGIAENDSQKIRSWLHRQAIERRK